MKAIILILFFVFFFMGCDQKSEIQTQEECINLGYKYVTETKLNYRTGVYELKFICLNKLN
jgi:uncharacterized lipoprotein NlpE involved in copper resistance